jgi:uncharacterized protein (DUF111 family)
MPKLRKSAATAPLKRSVTRVVELAVNLDDVTAQLLGDVQEQLLAGGALDVWTVAIGMKKQRPGVMLCVLCEKKQRDKTARLMLQLTGSFGVRMREWDRLVLGRRHETVATPLGSVRVKIGSLAGNDIVSRPEFEDVKQLAKRAGVTVREAMEASNAAAHKKLR